MAHPMGDVCVVDPVCCLAGSMQAFYDYYHTPHDSQMSRGDLCVFVAIYGLTGGSIQVRDSSYHPPHDN